MKIAICITVPEGTLPPKSEEEVLDLVTDIYEGEVEGSMEVI